MRGIDHPCVSSDTQKARMQPDMTLMGRAAAPGIALGPAWLYRGSFIRTRGQLVTGVHPRQPHAPAQVIPELERQRLEAALYATDALLSSAEARLRELGQHAAARMFKAYRLFLHEPALGERAQALIEARGCLAVDAIGTAGEEHAARIAGLVHPDLTICVADIRDLIAQVQRLLIGDPEVDQLLTSPAIIVSHDLSPFELMRLPHDYLSGIVLVGGGATAHVTILARALGIPAVTGLGPALLDCVSDMVMLAVDGDAGYVIVAPSAATQARMRTRVAAQEAQRAALYQQGDLASVTRDGRAITLLANVASPAEARIAREWGAEGIGSLRTELLFIDRPALPDEDEQVALYQAVIRELPGGPIVARTLDMGGDKHLPAFPLPREDNPFLGWRGIRISLSHLEELLLPQLRAMLRAGATADVRIVVPMIATLTEFRQVQAALRQAHTQLQQAGIPCTAHPQLGVLIEIPAAVLMIDALAREADFISIGTNDLTQYLLACDRTSPHVAYLYQSLEPAVLRSIAMIVAAAHHHGKRVSLCGEMASDTAVTPLLIGMGIDELSCAPSMLPRVRQAIRRTDAAAARELAQAVLNAVSLEAVRDLLDAYASVPEATAVGRESE